MGDQLLESSSEISPQQQNDVSFSGRALQREATNAAEVGPTQDLEDTVHRCHIRIQGTGCPRDEEVLSRKAREHRAENRYLRRKQWCSHRVKDSRSRMNPSIVGQQITNQERQWQRTEVLCLHAENVATPKVHCCFRPFNFSSPQLLSPHPTLHISDGDEDAQAGGVHGLPTLYIGRLNK